MKSSPILLLDLDGVVIFEPRASGLGAREILVLHRDLGSSLAAARQTTLILTHRSRREAEQIVRAAQMDSAHFVQLIAAEDLFRQACTNLRFRQLLRGGLQKSLALSLVERITGRSRDDVVILDDRQHNLDSLLAAGVGLALKAPSDLSADCRTVTTFDMSSVLQSLADWHADRSTLRQRDLPAVRHPVAAWQKSGLSTVQLERHGFNRARRIFYAARKSFFGKSG